MVFNSSIRIFLEDSNLRNIEFLRKEFGVEVGLSDHTLTNLAAAVSIGMGASAIEKHFKPSDSSQGPDASFSITPCQLKTLVSDCNDAWSSLGKAGFHRSNSEKGSCKYRRSLYFMKDLIKGSIIKPTDIRAIRPCNGLPPKLADEIIGKSLCIDVERGDPVTLDAFLSNE